MDEAASSCSQRRVCANHGIHKNIALYRNDIAKGLFRIPSYPILDSELEAPLFCVAFGMKDKTSIQPLTQRIIWAMNHVKTFLARGEHGAYIENIPGLKCLKCEDTKKEKWVIVRDNDHGENTSLPPISESEVRSSLIQGDDAQSDVLSLGGFNNHPLLALKRSLNLDDASGGDVALQEIDIEIRIHEARKIISVHGGDNIEDHRAGSPISSGGSSSTLNAMMDVCGGGGGGGSNDEDDYVLGDVCEHYLFLIVKSPLAFSFRRAVYESLQWKTGLGDSHQFLDLRRHVWNSLAAHVRETIVSNDHDGDVGDDGMSMASGSTDRGARKRYSFQELKPNLDLGSIEWMKVSNEDSFTSLFSVHKALDWVRNHFFSIHGDVHVLHLEGFGILRRGDISLTPSVVSRYVQYDQDVEKGLLQNHLYNSECKKKRRRGGGEVSDEDMMGEDGTGSVVRGRGRRRKRMAVIGSETNGPPTVVICTPRGITFHHESTMDSRTKVSVSGCPVSALVMCVVIPVRLETLYSMQEFEGHIKIFPTSVTLDILRTVLLLESEDFIENNNGVALESVSRKKHMNLYYHECVYLRRGRSDDSQTQSHQQQQSMAAADEHTCPIVTPCVRRHQYEFVLENRRGGEVTLSDIQMLVGGMEECIGRPMLSNGDYAWYEQCIKSVKRCPDSSESSPSEIRGFHVGCIERLRSFIRLALGLALTRSLGSDSYVNKRVAIYGRFMEYANGGLSAKVCCDDTFCRFLAWKTFVNGSSGHHTRVSRGGDPCHDAMMYVSHVLEQCNGLVWKLRPDNFHYFIQLMVSDIMLCLNYHSGVVLGAKNGIGATVIVRDGYGSYRRMFRDTQTADASVSYTQLYSKSYGSGADFVVSFYKGVVYVSEYEPGFPSTYDFITELKRSTEQGMMQDVCNITERHGNEVKRVHVVSDAMTRKYSTELKAGNDPQSQNCMQAISWLVARNTISNDTNVYKSTREHEKTKARVPIEYKQVVFGFWLFCSNRVDGMCRERFRALAAVSRSVASAANGLPKTAVMNDISFGWVGDAVRNRRGNSSSTRLDNRMMLLGSSRGGNDTGESVLSHEAKPFFLSGMCTAVVTAFMQWTGALGKVPSSCVLESLIAVFYSQLSLNECFLNPDMISSGEKSRYLEISKARGVAMSVLAVSMEETIESGRRIYCLNSKEEKHLRSIERSALRLMSGNTSSSIAGWIMADTLEHMFRLDFLILMQMLCLKFDVPEIGITLNDVLMWLKTGSADHCPVLKRWYLSVRPRILRNGRVDPTATTSGGSRSTSLTRVESCMYITHERGMRCVVGDNSSDMEVMVSHNVGKCLYEEYRDFLSDYCQITDINGGMEIVRGMISICMNRQFSWPSVFGTSETLPGFWLGVPPMHDDIQRGFAESLSLAPLRVILLDVHTAALGVDIRWLLLIRCLCGGIPSQSSRFALVGRWVQSFYKMCVPRYMMTSKTIWTGLSSPFQYEAFIAPVIADSTYKLFIHDDGGMRLQNTFISAADRSGGDDDVLFSSKYTYRCMLLRQCMKGDASTSTALIGTDAPIRSKVVEDLGPAAPRYELARILDVPERLLPTDSVSSYALPYGIWFPVLLRYVRGSNKSDESLVYFASLLVLELEDDDEGGGVDQGVRGDIPVYILCFEKRLIDVTLRISAASIKSKGNAMDDVVEEDEEATQENPSDNDDGAYTVVNGMQMRCLVSCNGTLFPLFHSGCLVASENNGDDEGRPRKCIHCHTMKRDGACPHTLSSKEDASFGLNGRLIVDVRPLCTFFRPGVLLTLDDPFCDTCDTRVHCVVQGYDFMEASYRVLCCCGHESTLDPYRVEDCVVPLHSLLYVKCGVFMMDRDYNNDLGGRSLFFYEKALVNHCSNTSSQQQSQQSVRGCVSTATTKHGIQYSCADVDGSIDVVECKLCLPREDLQTAYVDNDCRGNGYVTVQVIARKYTGSYKEIEALYTGGVAKDESRHILHINVHVTDILVAPEQDSRNSTVTSKVFFCIGIK